MSIYKQMVDAGVQCQNHYSDLYVPINDVTRPIVAEWPYRSLVKAFVNQVEGGVWYDIPFAFDPYWEKRGKEKKA